MSNYAENCMQQKSWCEEEGGHRVDVALQSKCNKGCIGENMHDVFKNEWFFSGLISSYCHTIRASSLARYPAADEIIKSTV